MVERLRNNLLACFTSQARCWVIGLTMIVVLLTGLWAAKQSGLAVDLQMRRELVRHAAGVAAAISPSSLRVLSFTEGDGCLPEFRQLCGQLQAYAETAGLHRLYTIALLDGQIVSGPESLPEGHPQASPPGTVCGSPDLSNFKIFQTGRPQIQGPVRGEYGTHVTALVPVIDPVSGDVLAVVGVDKEVGEWKDAVRRAQWVPGGITLTLLLLLLLIGLFLRLHRRSVPDGAARFRHTEAMLCAVFLTALSLAVAGHFHRLERDFRLNTFYLQAQSHSATYLAEMNDLDAAIDQMVCFFESSQNIIYNEFRSYCQKNIQRGLMDACIWAPAVSEESAGLIVQAAHGEGFPDFSIWQKNAKGVREPVSGRPEYYPVRYVVPSGSDAVLGLDLNSEPFCSAALQQALRTGLSTATDPVQLFSSANSLPVFLILKPVSAQEQKGLAIFAVHPENLLGGGRLGGQRQSDIEVCLSQLKVGQPPFLIAGSSGLCGPECWTLRDEELGVTVPVFRFGKVYALRMVPEASWLAAHPLNSGWIAGLTGLLITGLISGMVALITGRRVALERQVERRTKELKESETRFKDITLNTSDWVWETDANRRFSYASEKSIDLLGYTPQELIGKKQIELMTSAQAAEAGEFFDGVINERKSFRDYENWNVRKDGTLVCLLSSGIPVFAEDGTFAGYRGTDTDITARKRAEQNLTESEERYRLLAENIQDVVTIFSPGGKALYASPSIQPVLGYPPDDFRGMDLYALVHLEDLAGLRAMMARLTASGTVNDYEARFRTRDGSYVWMSTSIKLVRDSSGKPLELVCSSRNIEQRRQTEESLRTSQKFTEDIINAIPIQVFWKNKDLVFLGCNTVFAHDAGFDTPQEVVGKDDYQMSWRDRAELCRADDRNLMAGGVSRFLLEKTRILSDGSTETTITSKVLLRDENGEISGLLGVCMDITDRKKMENALRESQRINEAIIDAIPASIFLKDKNLVFMACNEIFAREAGFDSPQEVVGKDDYQMSWRDLAEPYRASDREIMESGCPRLLHEGTRTYPDGTTRTFLGSKVPLRDENGEIIGLFGMTMDITANKRTEQEVKKSLSILEATLESTADGIMVADGTGKIVRYNQKFVEMWRLPEDIVEAGLDGAAMEFVLNQLCEPELFVAKVNGLYQHPEVISLDLLNLRDGRVFERYSQPQKIGGAVVGRVWSFRDITDQKQSEEKLMANEDRYQRLAQHLETVREEERKRLSRELHDDIGQILTALKIDLAVVDQNCDCGGEVKEKTADMQDLLSDGIKSVHSLCRRLRPGALDDLGLEEALAGMVDEWQHRNAAKCVLFADVDDESFTDEIRTAVFRLVQEALTNISRYAEASRVEINLVSDGKILNFSVADNGRGMAPGAAEKPTSFGLLGMRERVEVLGGELCIESEPGQGTQIMGTLPLPL
ncbi:MAG: PAS domain S-box protein [Kiritimatiellaceae bacterium]|nr:PAS domain S-box protein [Kiritimatiellaceae bacterium]